MNLTRLTRTAARWVGAIVVAAVAPTVGYEGFTLAIRAVVR